MANNRINYSIGFNVDKGGLNELKTALQQIQQQASQLSGTDKMTKGLQESAQAAKKLEQILNEAYNSKLQQLNLNKVNQSIKTTYGSVGQLKTELEKSGAAGSVAYNKLGSQLLTTNTQLKQTSKLMDDLATSFANTVKWGISSSIFNSMAGSIQKAWSYTRNLDESLNNIRIVTGESADEMDRFAKKANQISKELGASTLDFTNAALIYYQQGLEAAEVTARATTTVKAANVTGQTGDEVSEQLTAVWNGYQVTAEETELYVDKLAAVAATTAADLEELSTGMSKVASAANMMGVDIDQLNGHLATVISVTRQAPESVGTAFKTIYARLGDLAVDGEDEFGTTLGEVSGKLKQMGIDILDSEGQMRDMGGVMEEVAAKWDTWTQAQKEAAAVAMAGKRQYNNLLALFENWDMYEETVQTSANAMGTLQEQQDIYMESVEAHLQSMRTEAQRTYDLMFNTKSVNGWIDALEGGMTFFNNFLEGINGGGNALLLFGSIAANVFDKQIAKSLMRVSNNIQVFKAQLSDAKLKQELIAKGVSDQNLKNGTPRSADSQAYQAQLVAAEKIFNVQKGLTQEQYEESMEINKQIGLETEQLALLKQQSSLTKEQKNNLALLKVEESTSGAIVRENINKRQEELMAIQEGKSALDSLASINQKVVLGTIERQEAEKLCGQYLKAYQAGMAQIDIEADQAALGWTEIVAQIKEGKFNLSFLGDEMSELDTKEDMLNAAIEAGNALLRMRNPELQDDIHATEQRIKLLNQENDAIVRQGESSLKIQKVVNIGMAAVGTIASMTGAMSAFTDETATGEQKAHAFGSAFSGVATAVGSAFGPIGMVVGGLIGSLGSLISQLDVVEDAFKSTEEKMQELQEAQAELISQAQEHQNAINSLTDSSDGYADLAEEYEYLSQKAGEYDEEINNLTEDERSRYNEIKSLILQYNPEALLAYNSENEAILAKNASIQETIDLLKEQYELETKTAFEENWEDQNKTRENIVSDAQDKYDQAKTQKDNINKENLETIAKNSRESAAAELTKYRYDDDDELAAAVDTFLKARENGNEEEAIDKLLEGLNKEEKANDLEWQAVKKQAQAYKDSFDYVDKTVAEIEDSFKQAEIELENAKQFDTSFITNTIKYIDDYSEGWTQLQTLDLEDPSAIVASFVDNLEYGKNGIESYEDAYAAGNNYLTTLYEVLSKVEDPQELLTNLENVDAYNFSSVQEYNQEIQEQVKQLIEDNKAYFKSLGEEQTEAFMEMLFGIKNVDLDSELNLEGVNTGYKQKATEAVQDLNTNFSVGSDVTDEQGNKVGRASTADLAELTPEQIDNFNQIQEHIDVETLATKGWKEAINEAVHEYEKLNSEIDSAELDKAAGEYDLDSDELKDHAERLMDVAESSDEVADSLATNGEAASDVAVAHKRLNKGLDALQDSFEDQKKALKNNKKGSEEYSNAMEGIKDAMSDVLNIDGGSLTDGFIEENLEDIEKAANGDVDAIERLRDAASKDILCQVMGVSDFSELSADMQNLHNEISSFAANNNLEIGATVDNADFLASCNQMIQAAGMTATEASNYFKAMGYDANVKTETKTIPEKTETYTEEGEAFAGVNPDGSVEMVPISTKVTKTWPEQTVEVPVVEALTYTGSAGGSVNFSNTKAGGASTGKGGGGGGGGGSTPKKTRKKSEKKFDRYRKVDNELEKLTTKLDRLTDAQDRLFGKDLLDNLNKQLKVLKQQTTQTEKKLKLARQEAAEMRTAKKTNEKDENGYKVKNTFADFGIKFNDNGEITNYKSKMQWYDNEIAKLEKRWNNMSAKEQENNEALSNRIEALKNNRDTLEELVSNYDDLIYEKIPGLEDEVTEQAYQQIEIKLQAFEVEANLRLEVTEAIKDWDDFKKQMLEFETAESLGKSGTLSTEGAKLVRNSRQTKKSFVEMRDSGFAETKMGDLKDLQKEQEAWRKNKKGYKGEFAARDSKGNIKRDPNTGNVIFDEKAFREKMKEAEDQLKEYTIQMEEWQQEATENLLNAIDLVGDAYARQQDTLDFIGSQIEHQLRMTELIKGEGAYEEMKDAYADAAENAEKMAATKEEEMNYYYKKMTQSDLTAEEREKWEEMYYAAAEEYSGLLEESVEAFKAQFENEVRAEAEKLFGPDNSKEQAEWEIQTKLDDEYLDQIDKAYELTTLENKMQEGLNKAGSTSAQKKINELMDEELEKLREKDKLTQYDIDRANARYELELKKIALEEAQNNKSQMRLRRDASGNYSYQFTADEDAIASAEQEVNDAQQGLREMDLEEQKRLQEKLFDLQKEYKDKWIEYNLLTEEEQKARQAEYQVYFDYYQSELGVSAERLGEVQKNTAQSTFDQAQTLYAQDKENFGALNADLKAILEDKTKTANDLTQSEIDMVNKELTPAWTGAAKEIAAKWSPDGNMTTNITKSQKKIDEKQAALNKKLDDFGKKSKESSDKSIEAAKKTLTQQEKVTKELKNQVKELEDIKRAVDDEAEAWDKLKKKIMDALEASNKYLKETAKKDADDIKDGKNKKTTTKKTTTTKTSGKSTKDGGNNDGGDGIPEVGDTVIFKSGKYHSDSYGGGPHGSRGIGKKTKINIINKGAPYPIHVQSSTGAYGWLKKEQLKGFDTGGYTGQWSGGEGKVAMLHSKELVLNAKDTENMLAMIEMVRELEGAFKVSSKTNGNEAELKELKKALNKAQDQQKELEKQAKYLKELTELQKEQKKLVKNQENAQKKELAQLEKALDKVVKEMSSEMKKTTASSKAKAVDKKSAKPVKAKAKKAATTKAKATTKKQGSGAKKVTSKATTSKKGAGVKKVTSKATTVKKGSGAKKATPNKADLMKEFQQAAKAVDQSKLSKDQKKALMNELDKFAKQTDKGQHNAKEVNDFLKDFDKALNKTGKGSGGGKAKSVTSTAKNIKSGKVKASSTAKNVKANSGKKVTSTKQKDLDKAKAAKATGTKTGKGSGSGGSNKLTKSSGGKGTKVVTSKATNVKSGKGSGSGGTKVKNKKLSNIEQLQAQIKDLDKAEKELQKQLKNAKKNSAKEKELKKQIEKLEKKEKQAKDKLQKEKKAQKDKQDKAAKEKALKEAKTKQQELEKELADAKKKAEQAEKEAKEKAKETKKEVEADLEQIKKIQEAELAYKAKLQEYYNLTEEERLAQRDEYLKSFTEYQKAIETANGQIKDKDLMQAVLAVGLKSSDSDASFGELGVYSTTGEASGNSVQLSEEAIIQNENMQLLSAQLEEAKANLAEIHNTDLMELLTVLKEMSGYVKTAKTSLYNIRHTDFVKLMEQLAITDNRVRLGRLSLYNIRHKDFVKLLGYFEEKKKDTATANQGRKVPKITTDLASGAAMTAMQKSLEKAMHSATKSVLQTSKLLNVLEQKTLNNLYNEKKNEVQQAITINAEFPNAADVKAISDALDSLVNQATQRAFTTIK